MKNACRIGRVRMKNGGADVRVLAGGGSHRFDAVFNTAKKHIREYDAVGAGYFILRNDGGTNFFWRADDHVYNGSIRGSICTMLESVKDGQE